MSDLARLARPFPRELVERDPQGNSYVAHENVTQWLLGIVGSFDYTLVEIIRGNVPGQPPNPQGSSRRAKDGTPDLHDVIVGGVWRLTLEVDGRTVILEEAGDVEDPHNWRHDGQRLKQAASDAIKRCAMRAGLGLHLWAGERYVLYERLQQAPPPADPPSNGHQPAAAWETGRDLLRDLHLSANDAARILRTEAGSDFGAITLQEVMRLRGDPLAKAAIYLRAATSDPATLTPPGRAGSEAGEGERATSGERRDDPSPATSTREPNPQPTAAAGSRATTSPEPSPSGGGTAGRGRGRHAGPGRSPDAPAPPAEPAQTELVEDDANRPEPAGWD